MPLVCIGRHEANCERPTGNAKRRERRPKVTMLMSLSAAQPKGGRRSGFGGKGLEQQVADGSARLTASSHSSYRPILAESRPQSRGSHLASSHPPTEGSIRFQLERNGNGLLARTCQIVSLLLNSVLIVVVVVVVLRDERFSRLEEGEKAKLNYPRLLLLALCAICSMLSDFYSLKWRIKGKKAQSPVSMGSSTPFSPPKIPPAFCHTQSQSASIDQL